jgi:hypothetical protein
MGGRISDLDRKNAIAAGVFILAVVIGLTPLLLDETTLDSRTLTFEANATAVNTSGNESVNLGVATGDKLNFGRIPAEGRSQKYFNVKAGKKALIRLETSGNISDQLEYEDKHFFEGKKEVKIAFNPERTGFYSGNVSMKIYTPVNEVGAAWLTLKAKLY